MRVLLEPFPVLLCDESRFAACPSKREVQPVLSRCRSGLHGFGGKLINGDCDHRRRCHPEGVKTVTHGTLLIISRRDSAGGRRVDRVGGWRCGPDHNRR